MTRFLSLHRLGLLAALLLVSTASTLHAQTITTFDPPNSSYTVPQAINNFGQITGWYNGDNGFLRQRDGTFTTFNVLRGDYPAMTFPTDINAAGQISGYSVYGLSNSSFLRQTDGTIVNFDIYPSAAVTGPAPSDDSCPLSFGGATAVAINDVGQITGQVWDTCNGFLRQPDGTITAFVVLPQLGQVIPTTAPQAINGFGQITGWYGDANGFDRRGFLRKPKGTIIRFDAPNSGYTVPQAINLLGQITGYYRDANFVLHASLRQRNGNIITFDPTGSISTQATAINLKGQITGFYATADGIYHGFLRRRDGNIEIFDIPGTGNGGTFPKDINDHGQIVGYYQDANFVLHGFVRSAR